MTTISLQSVRRGMRPLIASRARSCLAPLFVSIFSKRLIASVAVTALGTGVGIWLVAGAGSAHADGPGYAGCGQATQRPGNDPTCLKIPGVGCVDPAGSPNEKFDDLACGIRIIAGIAIPCGFPRLIPGGCP